GIRGPGPAGDPRVPQLRAVPRRTCGEGVSDATHEPDRAMAAGLGLASGEEPGSIRHETAAGEGGPPGADVAGWGLRGRTGERPGLRSFGEWQDALALRHRAGIGLALASWCAGSVIKQPCEPVPVTYAPGAHGPDPRRRVHRCAARLPARPRPAPLGATNSSPGLCSVPIPPSRCISPPVCSRSITPPVAVAGSRGCTLSASPGTR